MVSVLKIDSIAERMQEEIRRELQAPRPRVKVGALIKLQKELAGTHIAFHQAMARRRATLARREAEKIFHLERMLQQILFPPDPLDIRVNIDF